MNLFEELDRLPHFFYVIGDDVKLLGGHQTKPGKPMSFDRIYDLWGKMMEVHNQDELNDEDKIYLAKSMKKMRVWCEGQNIKRADMKEYINNLTESQQLELEKQINMYKDARNYYGKYIF